MRKPLLPTLLLALGLAGCATAPGKAPAGPPQPAAGKPAAGMPAAGMPAAEATVEDNDLASAVELFDVGELAAAEARFLALRQAHPENAAAALYLGRIYFEEQRYADAVDQLEAAVALDDTEVDHYLWLGRALGERIHKVVFLLQVPMAKRILAVFTRAIELDPERVEGQLALARFYSEAPPFAGGDRGKALHHAAELVRLDPLAGHLRRAAIYERFGEGDLAERELLAALGAILADRSDLPEAGAALERLEERVTGGVKPAPGASSPDPPSLERQEPSPDPGNGG